MGFFRDGFGACCDCTIRRDTFDYPFSGILDPDFYHFQASGWAINKVSYDYPNFANNSLVPSGTTTISWYNQNYNSLSIGFNILFSGWLPNDNFDVIFDNHSFNVKLQGTYLNGSGVLSSSIDSRKLTLSALQGDGSLAYIQFFVEVDNNIDASGLPYPMMYAGQYYYSFDPVINKLVYCNQQITPTGTMREFGIRINQGVGRTFISDFNFAKRGLLGPDLTYINPFYIQRDCDCNSPSPCFLTNMPNLTLEVEGFWDHRQIGCVASPDGYLDPPQEGVCASMNDTWMDTCVAYVSGHIGDFPSCETFPSIPGHPNMDLITQVCERYVPCDLGYNKCIANQTIPNSDCDYLCDIEEECCLSNVCTAITNSILNPGTYEPCDDDCFSMTSETIDCDGFCVSLNGVHELTWSPYTNTFTFPNNECKWRSPILIGGCGSGYFELTPTFTFLQDNRTGNYQGYPSLSWSYYNPRDNVCKSPSGIHLASLNLSFKGFTPSANNLSSSNNSFASGHLYVHDFGNILFSGGNFGITDNYTNTTFCNSITRYTDLPTPADWPFTCCGETYNGGPFITGHKPTWSLSL